MFYYLIKLEERKRSIGFVVFPKFLLIRYTSTSKTVSCCLKIWYIVIVVRKKSHINSMNFLFDSKKLTKHDTTNGSHSNVIMFVYLLQFVHRKTKLILKIILSTQYYSTNFFTLKKIHHARKGKIPVYFSRCIWVTFNKITSPNSRNGIHTCNKLNRVYDAHFITLKVFPVAKIHF